MKTKIGKWHFEITGWKVSQLRKLVRALVLVIGIALIGESGNVTHPDQTRTLLVMAGIFVLVLREWL